MAKVKAENKFLSDDEKRVDVIRRNAIQSSVFDGIYHVTKLDFLRIPLEPVQSPPRKID